MSMHWKAVRWWVHCAAKTALRRRYPSRACDGLESWMSFLSGPSLEGYFGFPDHVEEIKQGVADVGPWSGSISARTSNPLFPLIRLQSTWLTI
jgi:hypothetical protein